MDYETEIQRMNDVLKLNTLRLWDVIESIRSRLDKLESQPPPAPADEANEWEIATIKKGTGRWIRVARNPQGEIYEAYTAESEAFYSDVYRPGTPEGDAIIKDFNAIVAAIQARKQDDGGEKVEDTEQELMKAAEELGEGLSADWKPRTDEEIRESFLEDFANGAMQFIKKDMGIYWVTDEEEKILQSLIEREKRDHSVDGNKKVAPQPAEGRFFDGVIQQVRDERAAELATPLAEGQEWCGWTIASDNAIKHQVNGLRIERHAGTYRLFYSSYSMVEVRINEDRVEWAIAVAAYDTIRAAILSQPGKPQPGTVVLTTGLIDHALQSARVALAIEADYADAYHSLRDFLEVTKARAVQS